MHSVVLTCLNFCTIRKEATSIFNSIVSTQKTLSIFVRQAKHNYNGIIKIPSAYWCVDPVPL